MAFTETNFYEGLVGSNITILHTATAKSHIKNINICNNTSAVVDLTIWMNSTTADTTDSYTLMKDRKILKNDFEHWVGTKILEIGGTISAQASVSGVISISVDGAEI